MLLPILVVHPFFPEFRIEREFDINTLRLREDMQKADIRGFCAVDKELLLLADYNNRAVKELHLPTGRVELVYSELEDGWRVCNVHEMCDAAREFLVLLELKVPPLSDILLPFSKPHETRLSVVGKQGGKYCDVTHFALEKLPYLSVWSRFTNF